MARSSSHAPVNIPQGTRREAIVPVVLGAVAVAVTLIGSWNVSLWTDEAATVTASRRSLAELFTLLSRHDAVHGVYYLFMHAWTTFFGFSPVSLRFPSAMASGAAVVGVFFLARALGRHDIALLAGVIALVLPRITWMGIEARSFGPSAALAVWATVVLAHSLRRSEGPVGTWRSRWSWALYAVLVALAVAVNIYVALLVVAHGATVLLLRTLSWRRRLGWLVAAVAGCLAASPIVLLSASQRGQLGENSRSLTDMIRQAIINQWFLGDTPTRVTGSNDGTALWAIAAAALAAMGWIAMVAAVVAALRGRRDGLRYPVIVLAPWVVLPTIIAIGYSLAVSPLYNPRYFTFAAPAVALLIAVGIGLVRRPALRTFAVAVIVALCVPIFISQRQATGKSGTDWSQVAAVISERTTAGDGVYFAPLDGQTRGSKAPIGRTTRYIENVYPVAFAGLTDVTLRTTGAEDGTLRGTSYPLAEARVDLGSFERIWVVTLRATPSTSTDADASVLEDAGFRETSRWRGPVDEVVEYSR